MDADYHRLQDAIIADPSPYPGERFAGRGIVICAGGARMFTCAWVAINALRRLHRCGLPIQVWHLGPGEMGTPMRALLEEAGVEVVDACEIHRLHPVRTIGGYELKPYALIHSRFEEVLLLDADNLPAIDPAFLFDTPQYRDTGAIFWPDVVRLTRENGIWQACRLAWRDEPAFETGQAVVDKRRHWKALQLTLHMNEHSDFYFRHIYGDKDTFHMAWRMLDRPFSMPDHPVKRLPGVFCQHDFDGRLVFQHRNRAKWILHGRNARIAGFQHEEFCLECIADLMSLWDGCVFNPPPRSAAAADLERQLVGRHFRCVQISSDERCVELLAGNRIGRGRSDSDRHWHVEDGEGALRLVFGAAGMTTTRLSLGEDGVWRGRRAILERMPVELHALAAGEEPPPATLRGHDTARMSEIDWRTWKYEPLQPG